MRQGIRSDWSSIPGPVRADIDLLAGSPVRMARNLAGGFSPGPAARCELADGRLIFVKAAGSELNPDAPRVHRTEASVLAALPAEHPAPRLIGAADDGDWIALAIEWVDGTMPVAPLSTADSRRMLSLTHRLAIAGAGLRPNGILPFAERHRSLTGNWAVIAADGDGRYDQLDAWSRKHLTRLVELDAMGSEAATGDTLLHLDLRTDNVLFAIEGAEHDVVVDWPGAATGAAWIDLATLLPALHLDGAPRPDDLFDEHPLGRYADADAVTAFLSSLAGYFTRQALLCAPPGLPTLRSFQSAQGTVTRSWLARRLGNELTT